MTIFSIIAKDLVKKYNRQLIYKNFTATFVQNQHYAFLGPNGAGKSTLLKTLAQYLSPDSGSVHYIIGKKVQLGDFRYTQLSYVAPYVSLFREFTVLEMLEWITQTKGFEQPLTEILDLIQLSHAKHRFVKQLSSGMYQRLKVGSALLCKSKAVFLDEPCSNLDSAGIQWYQQLLTQHTTQKIIFIASNQAQEYETCQTQFNILDYK